MLMAAIHRITLLTAVAGLLYAPAAFACSCSNRVPIQRTSEKYGDKAVFTAHVIQLMGGAYTSPDGKRYSDRAIAIVHERYWGLPWYWPKVVVLDGWGPCGIGLVDDTEYLVSGWRSRYGVLAVGSCSRTQPLESAQLDLRTLDGKLCSAPGGALLGHVADGPERWRSYPPAKDLLVSMHDQGGKIYTTRTDSEGIYQFGHLPAGYYTVESQVSKDKYAASGGVFLPDGTCLELGINLRAQMLSGRLMAGIGGSIGVKLVSAKGKSPAIPSDSVEPDGRFYFENVPDGEYMLMVSTRLAPGELYYPGTRDRKKAMRIQFKNGTLVTPRDFNFSQDTLPLVPVPVTVNRSPLGDQYIWHVLLFDSYQVLQQTDWSPGQALVLLYGARGGSYRVGLDGYPKNPDKRECRSEPIPVTANPNLKTIQLKIPDSCQ